MNAHDFETIPQSNGDYSREDVVECTYNLIQTDEDCVPVEGSNIHLACPELEVDDDSTLFDVEAHISFLPDNLTANDGVTQSEWLQIADDLLPDDLQQSPSVPNNEDPSESRCAASESKAVITDSIVLKKLLRRTRYFDSGNSCLEDRNAVLPRTQNRRKLCYLCGQLLHDAKKCPKRRPCYSCKTKGHYAIDCPMNIKESERICLKCGETGHEISSCKTDYCPEDLKKIHCYVCNELGHIFCGNLIDENIPTVSCYNCGESGHSGLQCPKPLIDRNGSRPPSICYKCGEEGHVARRCVKNLEPSGFNQGVQAGMELEVDDADEDEKQKRGKKNRSSRHGRARRRKWRGLDFSRRHESVTQ